MVDPINLDIEKLLVSLQQKNGIQEDKKIAQILRATLTIFLGNGSDDMISSREMPNLLKKKGVVLNPEQISIGFQRLIEFSIIEKPEFESKTFYILADEIREEIKKIKSHDQKREAADSSTGLSTEAAIESNKRKLFKMRERESKKIKSTQNEFLV